MKPKPSLPSFIDINIFSLKISLVEYSGRSS